MKMDAAAKEVLKSQKTKIKQNLLLSDIMLDHLEEKDTLTEEIAQEIKAKTTNEQRIDKLLYCLKFRGEKAFDHFIEAIKTDATYERLATELEAEYKKLCHEQEMGSQTTVKTEVARDINSNIVNSSSTDSLRQPVQELKLQTNLNILYTRLKEHMTSLNIRELSFGTPKPITFQMLIDLQDQYMRSIDECYRILGVKEKTKSLLSHIVDLKARDRHLNEEIREKEVRINKLAHQYIKLENKHRALEEETKSHQKLIKKVDEITCILKDKEGKLEAIKEENGMLQEKLEHFLDHHKPIEVENKDSPPKRDMQGKRRNTYASLDNMYRKKSTIQSQTKPISTKAKKSQDKLGQNDTDFERVYKCNPQVKFDQSFNNGRDKNDIPLCIGNRTSEVPNSDCNPEPLLKGSPRMVPRYKASKRNKKVILELK